MTSRSQRCAARLRFVTAKVRSESQSRADPSPGAAPAPRQMHGPASPARALASAVAEHVLAQDEPQSCRRRLASRLLCAGRSSRDGVVRTGTSVSSIATLSSASLETQPAPTVGRRFSRAASAGPRGWGPAALGPRSRPRPRGFARRRRLGRTSRSRASRWRGTPDTP
jgi:hypothetical protein